MKILAAVALLAALGACSGGSDPSKDAKPAASVSAADAFQATCREVRDGIDEFNRQDYAGTVEHFEKARVSAKVYAKVNTEPEADALLDAVEYYADLSPEDYPDAARSSESFARNKEITLTQCASGEPIDETPGTPV